MDRIPSICFLVVSISGFCLAQNQAPFFIKDMSDLILPETTATNIIVYELRAVDPDGDPVFYLIDGDQFGVNKGTGDVYLLRPLDYELVKQIKAIVTASDGTSETHVSITVQVTDRNDELPIFSQSTYEKTLDENSPLNTEIIENLVVTDRDIVNAQLQVKCDADAEHILKYGDVCSMFKVVKINVNNIIWEGKLVLNGILDYEESSSYQVPLIAFDGENQQNRSVEVIVRDIQDTPPTFIAAPAATIDENVPYDYPVTRASAVDGDRSNKRNIVYELYINPENYFRINPSSGLIQPNINKVIDREAPLFVKGYVDLTIKARELISSNPQVLGNNPITTAETTVRINVNDVNDNRPEFDKNLYDVSIPEDIPTGSPLPNLIITITDKDQVIK